MNNRNEAGYSLVGVLLIFTIAAIVGISLIGITYNSVKTSSKERDNQAVYYIAEAGLNYIAHHYEQALLDIYKDDSVKTESDLYEKINNISFPNEYNDFEKIDTIQPFAKLEVEATNEKKYILTSTGNINGEERKVTRVIQPNWEEKYEEVKSETYELPPFAVFTNGQFTMSNGQIIGDIGTTATNKGAISFPSGGPTLEGNVYVPEGNSTIISNEISTHFNPSINTIDPSYHIPSLPDFPIFPSNYTKLPDRLAYSGSNSTYVIQNNNLNVINWITKNYTFKMENNLAFNEINLDQNNTLNLDLNNEDRSIVVNQLNLHNGHIKLIGNNKLTIYVRNKMTMGSGSTLNEHGQVNNVNIFFEGNNKVSLAGAQKIYGSIYAKNADLDLTGSGGIMGNIFTGGGSLTLAGGADVTSQLILAPNAHVNVTGGGSIYGKVISKSFSNSGGARIELKEPFILDGPISPSALGNNPEGGSGGSSGGNTETVETGGRLTFTKEKIKEVPTN